MKRSTVVVVALMLALVGTTAFGQAKWGGIARQVAMGGSNAGAGLVLNPFVWDDPAYMLFNPAYQALYKDYLWTNIGGGTLAGLSTADNGYGQQNAGLNLALNNTWTVGGVFSYDPSAANRVSGLIAGVPAVPVPLPLPLPFTSIVRRTTTQTIPPIRNVWEALASFDGGAMKIGFGFMYGTSNNETNASSNVGGTAASTSSEASSRMFGFRGGLLMDLGGGNFVDVTAGIRLDKATDKISSTPPPAGPTDGEYSASGTEIMAAVRLKLKVSNRVNFIPYAAFQNISAEPKEDTKPTVVTTAIVRSMKASAYSLAAGAGAEYKTPDVLLAAGLSFLTSRAKLELADTGANPSSTITGTYTAIPVVNIGGEWWFTDWLGGRAGYYRAIGTQKVKMENTATGASFTAENILSAPTSVILVGGLNGANFDGIVTLGVGFRFGNFSLDATVSEEALRRGFGLVGAQDNINSFGFLNASLNFQ